MVISHRHRLIFFKPHKVGSTSVMVALGSQCGPMDSVGGVMDEAVPETLRGQRRNMTAFSHLPTGGNHATPDQIRQITDTLWGEDLWQQYLRVTIVRNPWARAVSWWDYARHQLEKPLAFAAALENTERPYWFDQVGQRQAHIYLRCEQLDKDYRALCAKLGLTPSPLPRLRPGARDPGKPYWEYFDDRTRDLVEQNFALEIAEFGYRFGDPA